MSLAQPKIAKEVSSSVLDADYWREFAPKFTIGGPQNDHFLTFNDKEKDVIKAKLVREGYNHLMAPGLKSPLPDMAELFTAMVTELGLPPVFSFVYDELWALNTQMKNLLGFILHDDYAQLPDFWAWRVAPGQAGWKPHRDKAGGSLFPDNTPKSLTLWIPVTQAHPLNGCMYVLPADRDKYYGVDGATRHEAPLPDMRALPADAGDVLFWTQHVFHWGGHSADEHHLPPRMSVAFEYQRSDVPAFNRPLLDPHNVPPFDRRLGLIAKQVMQYRHMYSFTDELVAIAETILNR